MGIAINESSFKTAKERQLAFAHEVAHCEIGGFYTENTSLPEREKIEYRATKKTVEFLIPFNTYVKTIKNGIHNEWEQTEYWNIPHNYVSVVHQVYQTTRWDEIQALKASVAGIFE